MSCVAQVARNVVLVPDACLIIIMIIIIIVNY